MFVLNMTLVMVTKVKNVTYSLQQSLNKKSV